MKQTVRTFVALDITTAVRSAAEKLIGMLQASAADVKWVEPNSLHLTLKFLGDVPVREIVGVCDAVSRATAKVKPFELEIRGAGAFPNAARPRTLWLGSGEGEEPMVELHGHVEQSLGKLGYRKEHRRFHPHLTLGRVRRGGPAVDELGTLLQDRADFQAGRFTVSQLIIFSSELNRSGPVYEVLGRAKLA